MVTKSPPAVSQPALRRWSSFQNGSTTEQDHRKGEDQDFGEDGSEHYWSKHLCTSQETQDIFNACFDHRHHDGWEHADADHKETERGDGDLIQHGDIGDVMLFEFFRHWTKEHLPDVAHDVGRGDDDGDAGDDRHQPLRCPTRP